MNTNRTATWTRRLVASGIVVGSFFAASGTASALTLPAVQTIREAARVTPVPSVDLRLGAEVVGRSPYVPDLPLAACAARPQDDHDPDDPCR